MGLCSKVSAAPVSVIFTLLVLFSACHAAEITSTYETTWDCQLAGPCSFCPLCNNCQEGPGGTPGGCGYCKFCSLAACPAPECVGSEATVATAAASGGAPVTVSATNSNLKGRVLVLDVNSWQESDGAEKLPLVVTAKQCSQVCSLTSGCNAWTFCYKPEGCGMPNECKQQDTASSSRRSCSSLGPYGKCTADGKFPFLMCSLKSVERNVDTGAAALEYYPNGKEWTSGVVSVKAQAAPGTMSSVKAFNMTEFCQL